MYDDVLTSLLIPERSSALDSSLLADSPHDRPQRHAGRAVGEAVQKTLAVIASHADARVERDGAQEGDARLARQPPRSARRRLEDLRLVRAVGADEAGHVLHHAEDADAGLAAEINLLAHVQQADFLRRRHHHRPVDAGLLQVRVHAQVLVAGSRRGVDEQIVELPPLDVLEELFDQPVFLGPSPYDGVIPVWQHELHAHHAQVICHPHRAPPRIADMDCFGLDAHHFWNARPADVCVHDTHHMFRVRGESVSQHRRERRLAHTTFAAKNKNLVFYVGETSGDERNVGIGAFGSAGADGLIGAAGAGIALACKIGFGTGTVFYKVIVR